MFVIVMARHAAYIFLLVHQAHDTHCLFTRDQQLG